MEYTKADYEALYGEKRNAFASVAWADWLICAAVGVILAFCAGCTDAADAANIATDERAAHERHETVVASWYSYTWAPIKASDANVRITFCQQTDSTTQRWHCEAVR